MVTFASALAENPGCSIPELFERPYDIKAAYKLFKHPEAMPGALLAVHRNLVLRKMQELGTTLLLEEPPSSPGVTLSPSMVSALCRRRDRLQGMIARNAGYFMLPTRYCLTILTG